MGNRRFEMFEYRQVLLRMCSGDSDREIARAGLMGRKKLRKLRRMAAAEGWLEADRTLPENSALAARVREAKPHESTLSLVEPYRAEVLQWHEQGIDGTTIHQALSRFHPGSFKVPPKPGGGEEERATRLFGAAREASDVASRRGIILNLAFPELGRHTSSSFFAG